MAPNVNVQYAVPSPVVRQQDRRQRLLEYVEGCVRAGDVTHTTAAIALALWGAFSASIPGLAVPDAVAGRNGQFMFIWERDEHHLDLEVLPGGTAEYYYRNRLAGTSVDGDYGATIPDALLEKLQLFPSGDE